VLSQGTYGAKVAVPLILEMLERQGLRQTFFVPGRVGERHPQRVRAIIEAGHELGHHGYTHTSPAKLSPHDEEQELIRGLEVLRELGAEGRLDRVKAYVDLLGDEDCDVRRAAARRLGEIGSPAAVPKLTALARATRPVRGLFGISQQVPQCSAVEADAALKRISKAQRD
jgi:peptidoglycan/xylan/chitin deacetylase (PgdA/CDA1 family)